MVDPVQHYDPSLPRGGLSSTPIMDRFEKRMEQFWDDVEHGRIEYTEAETMLAKRLLELFPDNLLTRNDP